MNKETFNEHFEYLCSKITENIIKRRSIYEKTIMDFSLAITHIIRNNINVNSLRVFTKLCEVIDGYWFYEAHHDNDSELYLAYTRVYQCTRMLHTYYANNEYVNTIKTEAAHFKREHEVIQVLYDKAESPFTSLSKELNISDKDLKVLLDNLINKRYVCITHVGSTTLYALSNKGLNLLNYMGTERL